MKYSLKSGKKPNRVKKLHPKQEFEKCEYCNTVLLKQEDYESNLLPWLLYPSLSLWVYFSEVKNHKKPNSFYLMVQRKPVCSI